MLTERKKAINRCPRPNVESGIRHTHAHTRDARDDRSKKSSHKQRGRIKTIGSQKKAAKEEGRGGGSSGGHDSVNVIHSDIPSLAHLGAPQAIVIAAFPEGREGRLPRPPWPSLRLSANGKHGRTLSAAAPCAPRPSVHVLSRPTVSSSSSWPPS